MRTEQLLALPEDGTERWLIAGELREQPTTIRNRFHSRSIVRVARFLDCWLDEQPQPRGQILGAEVGIILRHDPDTTVGVDVVDVPADVMVRQTDEPTLIDGVPILAVEILSPSVVIEDVNEKIDAYLEAGVALAWIVDPYYRTVKVHRADAKPELFNVRQELTAEPHLPGFRLPVARLFD